MDKKRTDEFWEDIDERREKAQERKRDNPDTVFKERQRHYNLKKD